ncbi:Protein MIZU-KUSSEI 1-like, plant [Dillenia turbinata]|uniref:Protein MIZU-KUSSEI 1-like, plant n=1 Tax=Dillenia turbinata TaxID=194707 RepID=A0AAN8ZN72_9MAGN
MVKVDAFRRFLLTCFFPTTAGTRYSSVSQPEPIKKRLSTSLRDVINIQENDVVQDPDEDSFYESGKGRRLSTSSITTVTAKTEEAARKSTQSIIAPRASKSMVVGTIFGHRRGHTWLCFQHHRLDPKPALLLQLSLPTQQLVKEMRFGLVRLSLESDPSPCPLHSVPIWTLFCNGRKVGFARKRKATQQNRLMLKTMQSMTFGAGVLPAGSGFGFGADDEEIMYMRANYERVVGSADSESFHLINPEDNPGQELSIFLLRSG